jgi:hypothetical protein
MFEPLLVLFVVLIASIMGAVFYVITKSGFRNLTTPKKVVFGVALLIGLIGIRAGIYYYSLRGLIMDPFENAATTFLLPMQLKEAGMFISFAQVNKD